MVDLLHDVAAISVRHEQIRAHLLRHTQRQQKRHKERTPCERGKVKILHGIHTEIPEHKRGQQLGNAVRHVRSALILLRCFSKIEGIVRVLAVTGERGGRKARDPRTSRLFQGLLLLLGKRPATRLGISLFVEKIVVMKADGGQQMCA